MTISIMALRVSFPSSRGEGKIVKYRLKAIDERKGKEKTGPPSGEEEQPKCVEVNQVRNETLPQRDAVGSNNHRLLLL